MELIVNSNYNDDDVFLNDSLKLANILRLRFR